MTADNSKQSKVDTAFQCLVLWLNANNFGVTPSVLRRDYGKAEAWNSSDIMRAGKTLFNLTVKRSKVVPKKIAAIPTPCILEGPDQEYILLLGIEDDQATIQRPLSQKRESINLKDLSALLVGQVILLKKKAAAEEKPFGLSWFWVELLRNKMAFYQVLLGAVLIQIFAMVTPLFSMIVMDKVFTSSNFSTLNVLFVGLLMITLFDYLIGLFRKNLLTHATTKVDVILNAKVFRHLIHLPMGFFTGRQTGDTVTRIKELEGIRNFISGTGLTVLIDFPFAFLLAGLMYLFSPTLTWVVLAGIGLCFVVYAIASPFLKDRLKEKYRLDVDNQSYLVEAVRGMDTLKAMALEPQMQRRWENQVAEHSQFSYHSERLSANVGQIGNVINKGTIAMTMWLGATAVLNGAMTPGQMIAVNMLAGRVMAPAIRIAQMLQQLHQINISVKRLREIFAVKKEAGARLHHSQVLDIKGDIRFDHVSFRYSDESSMVLEDVSFEVQAGQIIGIVGPSGAGKTTLLSLMLRLYIASSGKVLLDGRDVAQMDPTMLRRNIGVVLQDNLLFNLSIKENIAIADSAISFEQVQEAAKLAGADDFIRALPKGYDTIVGEKGALLSVGQRQRIAIARALVIQPKLLFWDEATSALDTESEQVIQHNMQKICAGKTVFLVAHRLSTLRNADKLLVIHNSRIIEQGGWDELLNKKNGIFRQSYELQTAKK